MIAAVLAAAAMTAGQFAAVVDNASVRVERMQVAGNHDIDLGGTDGACLIVQVGDDGVQYVPAGTAKRVHNGRSGAIDVIVVWLKRSRTPAREAPAVQAPPGITRTPTIDNADVRVARVRFAPDGREPLHSHPYDLLTIQLTPAAVEMRIGNETTNALRPAGFIQFVPRDLTHAYASADARPFEILSVTIK